MKFIKINSKLIFGIILVFLAFAFIGENFLLAQLTKIEGISSKEYSYQGENSEIQGDAIACKEGFENCKLQITPKDGESINLELTQGAKYDPASGKISVVESGANFTINGNSFSNIKSGYLLLNQNTGEISEAKFITDTGGGMYNLGVVSFGSTSGEVDFSLDKKSLSLPEGSTLRDFDESLFFEKFKDEGLIVEGKNLEIFEDFSNKIFGNPPDNFKRFSGKVGFGQVKELMKEEQEIVYLKKDLDKYFIFVPEEEIISFPDAGVNVESKFGKTFVSFGGEREDVVSLKNAVDKVLRKGNLIIESSRYPSYVSLGEDKVHIDSGVLKNNKIIELTFNENSHYAGFNIGDKGHFSFKLDSGIAELEKNIINVYSLSAFRIEDGGDAFYKNSAGKTGIDMGKGKLEAAPVGFKVFDKGTGKSLFSTPLLEYYKNVAAKGDSPSQLIYFSSGENNPVYIDKGEGSLENVEKGYITLSEAYEKRSEIAKFYYNHLLEKSK